MLLNPGSQRRGQDELDRVVGKDNLPTLEDRPNLPYIEAICKESLRYASCYYINRDCLTAILDGRSLRFLESTFHLFTMLVAK